MKYLILTALVFAACGYNSYAMKKHSYGEPDSITKKQVIEVFESVDLTISEANSEFVESNPIRKYVGDKPRTVEYQVWVKVYLHVGSLKIYCTQRKIYDAYGRDGAWKFKKCTDPYILREIDRGTDVLDYLLSTAK